MFYAKSYMLVQKIFCVPAPLRESTFGGKGKREKKVEASGVCEFGCSCCNADASD